VRGGGVHCCIVRQRGSSARNNASEWPWRGGTHAAWTTAHPGPAARHTSHPPDVCVPCYAPDRAYPHAAALQAHHQLLQPLLCPLCHVALLKRASLGGSTRQQQRNASLGGCLWCGSSETWLQRRSSGEGLDSDARTCFALPILPTMRPSVALDLSPLPARHTRTAFQAEAAWPCCASACCCCTAAAPSASLCTHAEQQGTHTAAVARVATPAVDSHSTFRSPPLAHHWLCVAVGWPGGVGPIAVRDVSLPAGRAGVALRQTVA
jgi:hypothetical protein